MPFTLVLTGGVLRHPSPCFREALIGRVQEVCPGAHVFQSRFEPAAGAVLLALDLACIETNAALMDRLEETLSRLWNVGKNSTMQFRQEIYKTMHVGSSMVWGARHGNRGISNEDVRS